MSFLPLLLATGLMAAAPPTPAPRPAEDVAREHLATRLAPAGELACLGTATGEGGVRFVTFEQRFDAPVAFSRTTVAVDASGRVVAANVGSLAPARPQASPSWTRPIGEAVDALGLRGVDGSPLRAAGPASPVVLAATPGAEPALRVRVRPDGDPSAVEDLYLSAVDGRLLRRESAHFDAVAAVRAWPQDPSQPSVLMPLPDPAARPSVHSPLGWADALETSGNNVRVVLDRAGLADPDGPRAVASGDPAILDFPFTGVPADDADAALANVFWVLNDAHDRFRALGFDEPAGAMQDDGYGRGGAGGDRLVAFVQAASIDGRTRTNVLRLSTGADGTPATMTIGVFEVAATNELRDPSFDRDLLIHEYAHGVLARMLGDAACFNGHHPRGLSEGWADYFAASFTNDGVIGAWTRDDPVRGMRSSSLDDNFYSLANFCLDGCNPNRNGEIWAGLLWDVRRALIARLGAGKGAEAADQLAFEALRYLPCTPTFLDARKALLLAEDALLGGAMHCEIWGLLQLRGMGADATTTGPGDPLPQAGYAMPPQCTGGSTIELDAREYGPEGVVAITVLDGALPALPSVRVTTTSGDAESFALAGAMPWLRARVQLVPGAPVPDDGTLQVADGDTITATYAPRGVAATAGVSAAAPVTTVLHLVLGSACQADDDHAAAPAFFFLPGFLDAGEAADILVAAWSSAPGPLVDATVEVESLNPHVSVAPGGPIALGTIAAAPPGGTTLIVFTVTAAASPDVVPGETAELLFRYRASGRSGETRYTITLSQDYVVDSLTPFAGGVETFEADSPTRAGWTHQATAPGTDAWGLQGCAGDGGGSGMANASAGCGPYADGQGTPVLLSPVLVAPMPPDTVGWRVTELAWRHLAELYEDPARAGCERDVVAAFLTTDPSTLPVADPAPVVRGTGGALRVLTPAQNTAGFADGTPATNQTGAVYGASAGGHQLAWIFYGDATDPAMLGCVERANAGRFFLDDVRFRYEVVRQVPEATPCSGECKVLLRAAVVPSGPACPGDAFELDASGSSIAGCSGAPVFSFAGPGVPAAYASTPLSRAPAIFDPAGSWDVAVSCDAGPSCSSSVTLAPTHASVPGRGWSLPRTLRARRVADDVELRWIAAADPQRHGAWRATTRAQVASAIDAWDLVARADVERLDGEVTAVVPGAALEPGLACYRVAARDPCTDAPR